ncbi:hypothetical protein [Ruegeria hyattellae]|uniref:hypothetical protein n=1 Tax=Ruegeria hyattellae TaxID=3233337 RepID=UPI00355B44B6
MMITAKEARPVRAIVYGVGEMGSIFTRFLVERGVDIVGVIGRSESKIGRDLGDVVSLGTSLGVKVEADAKAVLARGADIAIVCVGTYLETTVLHGSSFRISSGAFLSVSCCGCPTNIMMPVATSSPNQSTGSRTDQLQTFSQ